MSRPYTKEEMRTMLLNQIRAQVTWWENDPRVQTAREKLEGLAFSILVIFDGGSGLPAFELVPAPHPDDRVFHETEGENYWPEDDEGIHGDTMLHEEWRRLETK